MVPAQICFAPLMLLIVESTRHHHHETFFVWATLSCGITTSKLLAANFNSTKKTLVFARFYGVPRTSLISFLLGCKTKFHPAWTISRQMTVKGSQGQARIFPGGDAEIWVFSRNGSSPKKLSPISGRFRRNEFSHLIWSIAIRKWWNARIGNIVKMQAAAN